jgi:signal transduction histidine kinase
MERETSCINSRAILDYVREYYDGDYSFLFKSLDPELDHLPDIESFLKDPNNWISCDVISKLYGRVRILMKDDMAAFKMAKLAVRKTSLGYAQRIIFKALWSSKKAVKNLQKLNDKWNRNKKIELVQIKGNKAVIRLHWDPRMASSRDICLYNQGAYTYIPMIWGGKPNILQEVCCYFEGAPYCEYHVILPVRNRIHEFFSRFFTSKSVLMDTISEMERDKAIIEQKYQEVNQLNVQLSQRIRQLMAVQETGKAILSVLDIEQLLSVIMNILCNVCQIHRAIIMLVNEEEGCLEYMHGIGFDGQAPDAIKSYRVPLSRVSNILVRVTNTGRPEYVPKVESSSLRRDNVILSYGQPSSVYVVPLITRSKVIGVIASDGVDDMGVPKETRETLEIFASQIAIAIENAKLYSKLQERMVELKRSHALLSRAEKFSFLGNLAARLAHEIKNPMTAIGTFIQMLPKKFDDEEFRKAFYEIALEETERVNNLITELLDLVKTRESNFEFCDLQGLMDKMILLVSPRSNEKNVEIRRRYESKNGPVWMDSEKMKQVFLNLLSNAVDFTPVGGIIGCRVHDRLEKGKPQAVQIEISDNGPGIPADIIDKIFDPYFTTKHKSNMHSGTGLGLFISHQNMQDHGGTIDVKSNVNEGTTFILTLPTRA